MKISSVIFMLFLFLGCSNENTPNIGVDFVWDLKHLNLSPEIHLENVPGGVDRLDIQFVDASNNWEHGGGTIAYDGSGVIPAGAVKGFKGLSSTWAVPKIEITVNAFNNNGQLIGRGAITKKPPRQ